MPITLRCPLCNSAGQIQRTEVITKRGVKGIKGTNNAPMTTKYYVRCSDPKCCDENGEAPRWNMIMEFAGWAYNPLSPMFEEVKPTYPGLTKQLEGCNQ